MRQETVSRISVVVPCMDRRVYLRPTIGSILDQRDGLVDCVVMDGGSTDGSLEVLTEYGDRIRWRSEQDLGPADAISKGWAMGDGDVLAWLNADDVWASPETARIVTGIFDREPEVDVVYGECGAIDAEGNLLGLSYLHRWDTRYAVENCDHCIPQPAAFIRRTAVERAGGLDQSIYHHDHDLWLRIALTGGQFRYVPRVLAHARTHPGNLHAQGIPSAASCVQVTRKLFARSDLPADLRRLRRRAMANSYRRGMRYLHAARSDWSLILRYAATGVAWDPRVTLTVMKELEGMRRERPDAPRGLGVLAAGRLLKALGRRIPRRGGSGDDLAGDRSIEWSFVAARVPVSGGRALDVGPGQGSDLGFIAALRGFDVTAVDLEDVERPYRHPRLRFLRGDVSLLPLQPGFNLVINCSTIEHAGMAGRYGVQEDVPDADLTTMRTLHHLMDPNGVMLLTIPVGRDAVFPPFHRVYGSERLPRLIEGFAIEEEQFWAKHEGSWRVVDRGAALDVRPGPSFYALGCFVLKRN